MQSTAAFCEKCQQLTDQIKNQAMGDAADAAKELLPLEQDLAATEKKLKECINWKCLSLDIDNLRSNAKLFNYHPSFFGWGIILAILYGPIYLLLNKLHNPANVWLALIIACIPFGGIYYWMARKRIHGLSEVISVYLIKLSSSNDAEAEYRYKFTLRGLFSENNSKPTLTVMTMMVNQLEETFKEYAIGLFYNSNCIGYLVEYDNCWKLYSFKSAPTVLDKQLIASDIRQLIGKEPAALERLQTAVGKSQQISTIMNNPINMDKVRKAWSTIVLNPNECEELSKALVAFVCNTKSAPRGILLKGPPGTGKSISAQAFAESSGAHFIKLSVSDIKSKWIGESGQKVKELWSEARAKAPSIIFVDECEGIFAKRGSDQSDTMTNEMVQNFLTQWDGIGKSSRVLVIGATNRAELLDDAVLSRFTDIIELLPADASSRPHIVAALAKQVGLVSEVPQEVISALGGLSGREMRNVMERASRIAMSDSPSLSHYEEAISKIRGKSSTKVDSDATWDTLILPNVVINRLKAMCQMIRDAEVLSSKGIPVTKALLLYGPPGTGKTQIARTLANEAGVNFVAFSTADLKGQFLGHAANRVKQAFESARASSPSIVFIDEIDALTSSRNGGDSDTLQKEALTQLLQELDGVVSKSGNVLVVAATNVLNQIDTAILSRFSQKLEIGLPTASERTALLQTLLTGRPVKLTISLEQLAARCEGYSGRQLRELVTEAFNYAVERVMSSGGVVQNTELSNADIERALQQ